MEDGRFDAVSRPLGNGVTRREALELERLDRLHVVVWEQATRGRLASTDRVLSIMKRRSALLGLDAPKRREPTGAAGGPLTVIVRERPDGPQ